MRTSEIKWGPVYRGRDVHETPEGRSYNLANVYRTRSGSIRKRPGYAIWKNYSTARALKKIWYSPVLATEGIFVFRNSAGANAIVDFIQPDLTLNNLLNASNANILNNIDVSVVAVESDHIIVGGGVDLVSIDGAFTGSPTIGNLTNAPAGCTSPYGLTFARGYVLMSVTTAGEQQLTYFNNNASFSYDTAADWRSFENNRKPDALVDLFNIRDEIVSMSNLSTEFAWLDGVTPWAEVDASYIPYGGYNLSKAQIGDSIFGLGFVDGVWKFFKILQNHSMQDISASIQSAIAGTIQGTTSGAFNISPLGVDGSAFSFDGSHFYIATDVAADANISLVYHDDSGEWYRWGATATSYWPLRCFITTNWVNMSGGTGGPYILAADTTANQKIFSVDSSYKADDGSVIECVMETGQITHGTPNEKRCHWYRFLVKRVDNGSFTLYTNDENGGYDSGTTVSLDPVENAEYVMTEVRAMGTYRTRQIKLSHSSSTDDFEIIKMWEGYEVLGQ